MKSIEQLLQLSLNPFYELTTEERQRLDDFLARERARNSKDSRKKNSKKSASSTRVRVKNIVKKTDTEPTDVDS